VSAAADKIERYRSNPVAFCREVLGFEPWSKQAEILESVRDNSRTAVRSCHAAGKTATAARAALWFLAVFPHSKVVTTAPTWAQVRDLLWREIRVGYEQARGFVGGEIFDTRLELATDWLAFGLSTDRPERFQGHHAEHLLLVVDEASGVAEEIFEASAGFLTSPGARALLIGNPTKTSGEFFAAFHGARSFYNTIHIPAEATPAFTGEKVPAAVLRQLVSRQWVDEHRRKWGERSPLYQVRVEARFPSQSDDVVVALGDLEDAQARTLEPGLPLVLAVDVARFGSDQTVFAARAGNVVRIAKSYGGRSTMETVGAIIELGRRMEDQYGRKPTIVVDDAGLGGGVVDRLRELGGWRVVAFLGAGAARDAREYPNARSQSWFDFADVLPLIDLDDDEDLATDLLAPRYVLDSAGRRVVEAKAETKRRLRRSPDRGDSVVMAFSIDPPGQRPRGYTSTVAHGSIVDHIRRSRGRRRPAAIASRAALVALPGGHDTPLPGVRDDIVELAATVGITTHTL
jgi:phage terminase large subunit